MTELAITDQGLSPVSPADRIAALFRARLLISPEDRRAAAIDAEIRHVAGRASETILAGALTAAVRDALETGQDEAWRLLRSLADARGTDLWATALAPVGPSIVFLLVEVDPAEAKRRLAAAIGHGDLLRPALLRDQIAFYAWRQDDAGLLAEVAHAGGAPGAHVDAYSMHLAAKPARLVAALQDALTEAGRTALATAAAQRQPQTFRLALHGIGSIGSLPDRRAAIGENRAILDAASTAHGFLRLRAEARAWRVTAASD